VSLISTAGSSSLLSQMMCRGVKSELVISGVCGIVLLALSLLLVVETVRVLANPAKVMPKVV